MVLPSVIPLTALLPLLLTLLTVFSPAAIAQSTSAAGEAGGMATAESREAATTPVPDSPRPYKSREERQMQLLAKAIADRSVSPGSVMWMKTDGEEFLAFYEPDYTGTPQGAVLLLHAEGQHPGWPATLNTIRTYLPNHGWSTLAMMLPSPDSIPPPPRDPPPKPKTEEDTPATPAVDEPAAADQDQEPAPQPPDTATAVTAPETAATLPSTSPAADTARESAEARAMERIAEAMRFLHSKNLFNIVIIGDGIGAARATAFLHSLADMRSPPNTTKPQRDGGTVMKPIRAIIIVNARNRIPASDTNLPLALMDPEVATLDIYFGVDRRDQSEAQRRKRAAQRQKFQVYQQLRLPELAGPAQNDNRLSRRIRGFLAQHARGIRVDNATVQ